jgi:hypothetical protein
MFGLNKLEFLGVGMAALAIALLVAYWMGYHKGERQVQAKFDLFIAQTQAAGEKAKADAVEKEKDYAAKISVAVSERDSALARVRNTAARAVSRVVPYNPATAGGSHTVCYDRAGLDAAFGQIDKAIKRFVEDSRGIALDGSAAQVNEHALIESWPK